MSDFHEVPVVDLRGIYSSERDDRAAVAKAIGDACRNVGFFYVKNHNVPEKLMVFVASLRFAPITAGGNLTPLPSGEGVSRIKTLFRYPNGRKDENRNV